MQGIKVREGDSISILIAAARKRIKQVVWSGLVDRDLTPQQFWVLLHLHEGQGLSLHELAESIWTDDPTASRIVAKLVDRKLIRTESDPSDRRRFRLELTPKGKKLSHEMFALRNEMRAGIERDLSPSDRQTLTRLLRTVIGNADQLLTAARTEAAPPARSRRASG
jgi:DNA-binding MarR family transcriptional regulator